jgi:hypothetical protein
MRKGKNMRRTILALAAFMIALPGSAQADRHSDTLTINHWRMWLNDNGIFGQTPGGGAGGEWPLVSRHKYVFGAGLWVGAVPGDTLTSVSYDPFSGNCEFTPGDSLGGPSDTLVRMYTYRHRWPAPAGRFPRAPQNRISDQDAWCCFNDFDSTKHDSDGRPMGLQVYQTAHASQHPSVQDAVFLRYEVENQSAGPLPAVYLGFAFDYDIGGAMNDCYRGFYRQWFHRGSGDSIYLDNLVCGYSEPEPGWDTTGTVAIGLVRTPGNHGVASMKYYDLFGFNPGGDKMQYLVMSGFDIRRGVYAPIDTFGGPPSDLRVLLSVGPFDLAPGQSESLVVVMVGVNCRPDVDSLRIAEAVWTAESAYLAGLPYGIQEPGQGAPPGASPSPSIASIVHGVLFLGDCPRTGTVPKTVLLDISGRKVLDLHPGPNDVRALAPGVYFVRGVRADGQGFQGQSQRVVVLK